MLNPAESDVSPETSRASQGLPIGARLKGNVWDTSKIFPSFVGPMQNQQISISIQTHS
jgi:hypothetical protein